MQVEVKNITHIYSEGMPFETKALEDVSFVVPEAEFAAIIGHTGSGKSTLLQIIAGLIKPSRGEIVAEKKKIGIVFQYPEYQLFEESVLKDICFGPKNMGLPEDEQLERAKKAMALVGIDYEAKKDVSPFDLSGGEKRRVAIAGVLAMDPELLILDEPTAGLDPLGQADILSMIDRVRRDKKISIILVSHNMDNVANLASHVLVFDKGRKVLDGTPSEVFAQAEMLKSMGLDLPSGASFIEKLSAKGLNISGTPLTFEETAELIDKYLKNGN